ncbi:MAG: hypothetical protein ACPLRA_02175 [Candidatus Saccharicenans sp.]
MYGRNRGSYGYGGYGRGFGPGFGRGSGWFGPAAAQVPEGYRYIGPCRCGWGPNAFYQDPNGRVFQAWEVYRRSWAGAFKPTQEELKAEIEALKAEKEELEKRIDELEKQIKDEPEKTQV